MTAATPEPNAPSALPPPWKLAGVLALVAGLAAGLLALTYALTKDAIERQEGEARVASLRAIFFHAVDAGGAFAWRAEALAEEPPVFALYREGEAVPAYFAAIGRGVGYNAGAPIELMAGFVNDAHPDDARTLLADYVPEDRLPESGARGLYGVGFKVVKSEETPGLGEKIKDQRPPATWGEILTGTAAEAGPDRATDFQAQFRGLKVDAIRVGESIDAITAATITTNGVVAALRDAAARLAAARAASAADGTPR